jgi:hypothetical protein
MSTFLTTIEQQLSTAIGQQETGNGSAGVGISLNNPGGLQYANWETSFNATPAPNSTFASFPSLTDGYQAMMQLIDNYVQSGSSLTSLIAAWSPASGGNANNDARVAALAAATGLDPTASIASQTGITPSTTSAATAAPITASSAAALASAALNAAVGSVTPSASSVASAIAPGLAGWIGRGIAIGLGAIMIVVGLLSLKSTQVIVQPLIDGAKKAASAAAA